MNGSNATNSPEMAIYGKPEINDAMEAVVKELVNLLLPANLMMNKMSNEAVTVDGSQRVAVDRSDLDSALHLVNHAHLVAVRLRDVLAAAKFKQSEAAPIDDAQARPRDDARPQEGRQREESWRKDIRDTVRSLRSA